MKKNGRHEKCNTQHEKIYMSLWFSDLMHVGLFYICVHCFACCVVYLFLVFVAFPCALLSLLFISSPLTFFFLLIVSNPRTISYYISMRCKKRTNLDRKRQHVAKKKCLWQHTFWPWSDYQQFMDLISNNCNALNFSDVKWSTTWNWNCAEYFFFRHEIYWILYTLNLYTNKSQCSLHLFQ